MKYLKVSIVLALLVGISLSCSKYPDGSMSLRTKHKRITGAWKLSETTDTNMLFIDTVFNMTTLGAQFSLDIGKWGDYNEHIVLGIDTATMDTTINKGYWYWNEDKSGFLLQNDSLEITTEYFIDKLSMEELVVKPPITVSGFKYTFTKVTDY